MKFRIALITVPLVLFFDQLTKYFIYSRFRWGESLVVIRNFFDLTYLRNRGAAFSLMDNAPEAFRNPFFLIFPVVASAGIVYYMTKLPKDGWMKPLALSLILGGAVGNLIDRIRFGFVVDFLYFHMKDIFYWPAFNVADSCIVVGVGLLYIDFFLENRRNKANAGIPPVTPEG